MAEPAPTRPQRPPDEGEYLGYGDASYDPDTGSPSAEGLEGELAALQELLAGEGGDDLELAAKLGMYLLQAKAGLEREVEQLRAAEAGYLDELTRLQETVHDYKAQLAKSTAQHDLANQHIADLQAEIVSVRLRHEQEMMVRKELQDETSRLQRNVDRLTDYVQDLEEANTKKKVSLQQLQAEINRLHQDMGAQQPDGDTQGDDFSLNPSVGGRGSSQLGEALAEEQRRLQHTVATMQADIMALQDELAKASRLNEDLYEQVEETKAQGRDKDLEIERLQATIALQQEQLADGLIHERSTLSLASELPRTGSLPPTDLQLPSSTSDLQPTSPHSPGPDTVRRRAQMSKRPLSMVGPGERARDTGDLTVLARGLQQLLENRRTAALGPSEGPAKVDARFMGQDTAASAMTGWQAGTEAADGQGAGRELQQARLATDQAEAQVAALRGQLAALQADRDQVLAQAQADTASHQATARMLQACQARLQDTEQRAAALAHDLATARQQLADKAQMQQATTPPQLGDALERATLLLRQAGAQQAGDRRGSTDPATAQTPTSMLAGLVVDLASQAGDATDRLVRTLGQAQDSEGGQQAGWGLGLVEALSSHSTALAHTLLAAAAFHTALQGTDRPRHTSQAAMAGLQLLGTVRECLETPSDEDIRQRLKDQAEAVTAILQELQASTTEHLGAQQRQQQQVRTVVREMDSTATAVSQAARRIEAMLETAKQAQTGVGWDMDEGLLEGCGRLMDHIHALVTAAAAVQMQTGGGEEKGTERSFYKKDHRWGEGLVSAAKAVGWGATVLVDSTEEALRALHAAGPVPEGRVEQLVVASREVAASVAQLVTASRVKGAPGEASAEQQALERASKEVSEGARALVKVAQDAHQLACAERQQKEEGAGAGRRGSGAASFNMSALQSKRLEMEIQVRILQLEAELDRERGKLTGIRKAQYRR